MDSLYSIDSLNDEFRIIQIRKLTDKAKIDAESEEFAELVNNFKQDVDYIREGYMKDDSPIDVEDINVSLYYELDPNMKYLDQVQEIITTILSYYEELYNFSSEKIKDNEWDLLFNSVYDFYKKNDMEEFFYTDMSKLNKLSISIALLAERDLLITDYISAIEYLNNLYQEDKNNLLETVKKSLCGKVVNFNKYKVKRRFDKN